jgi:hypothetical protein
MPAQPPVSTPKSPDSTPLLPAKPRLLDQVRARLRLKHYSLRTERAYVDWIRRFILFHGQRHPRDLGAADVVAFLSHLAVERTVAATNDQAPWPASPKIRARPRRGGGAWGTAE